MAAQIMIRFFMIYCPTRVKAYGDAVNETSLKKKSGMNVQTMCAINTQNITRFHFPKASNRPKIVSQIANKTIEICVGMSPNVIRQIVSFAN